MVGKEAIERPKVGLRGVGWAWGQVSLLEVRSLRSPRNPGDEGGGIGGMGGLGEWGGGQNLGTLPCLLAGQVLMAHISPHAADGEPALPQDPGDLGSIR